MTLSQSLKQKISNKDATLCIIGLGQVGIPTALKFCDSGFQVIGHDIKRFRSWIKELKNDESKYDVITSPPGRNVKFEGDAKDWEILKCIAGNARIELQRIAEKVGLSAKAVSYRMKNLVKKEIKSYTQMINVARDEAVQRMTAEAHKKGADAVVNVRFTTSDVMQGASEVMAYGTAVRLK